MGGKGTQSGRCKEIEREGVLGGYGKGKRLSTVHISAWMAY